MATLHWDDGSRITPVILPDTLTTRQAGTAIAGLTSRFEWWYGDWRLFTSPTQPHEKAAPGLVLNFLPPDMCLAEADGFFVVLGWIHVPEIWN